MDHLIVFTPSELAACVLGLCGLITAVAAAGTAMLKMWRWLRKPNTEQDERLDAHDKTLQEHTDILAKHGIYFKNDKCRMDDIEDGNKVTQKAILALLANAIDGNNVQQMENARDDLQNYLVNK